MAKGPVTIKRSTELTAQQWANLETLALAAGALAQRGPTTGTPSWRALLRALADGDLWVCPRPPGPPGRDAPPVGIAQTE